MDLRGLNDSDPAGKRVLLRLDLNLPLKDGKVTEPSRLVKSLPTIRYLLEKGAKILILSHFGRPGSCDSQKFSLLPLKPFLEKIIGKEIFFFPKKPIAELKKDFFSLKEGEIGLLENIRLFDGEEREDENFARDIASLGEIYVNDAFSCSHRNHSSVTSLAKLLPSFAGAAFQAECRSLGDLRDRPARPFTLILGGAKISTKIGLAESLLEIYDNFVPAGGVASCFLSALGYEIGDSFIEPGYEKFVLSFLEKAEKLNKNIIMPIDLVVYNNRAGSRLCSTVEVSGVGKGDMIMDIGPGGVEKIAGLLKSGGSLFWNGPLGAFETEPFDRATVDLARAVAGLTKNSVIKSFAGGGDTLAALKKSGFAEDFTYISTGGGAALEFLSKGTLPGIEVLLK